MKTFAVMFAAVSLICSCGGKGVERETFTIETLNKTTPVKDQGRSSLCWVYAMLAVIESDRIAMGDSVNLSAAYVARNILARMAERRYLTQGESGVYTDGVAPQLLCALEEYGAMPYDAYRSECNFDVLCRRLATLADNAARRRTGIDRLREKTAYMLDTAVNPLPRRVWMYGAEYTPQEFARSLCSADDYVAMTSYTHYPFGASVCLDVPANHGGHKFLNVPVDSLVASTERALLTGRSVCWEGDTTNPGFSFENGVARLDAGHAAVTQAMRQRAFETFGVTDDHCMAIIGLARDSNGHRYYVCKNSWGTGNPYGGLMYMSEQYFRLNTVAVVMKTAK